MRNTQTLMMAVAYSTSSCFTSPLLGTHLKLCNLLHVNSFEPLNEVLRGLRLRHAAGTCRAHCWSHGARVRRANAYLCFAGLQSSGAGYAAPCSTSGSSLASSFSARVLRAAA